MKRLGRVIGLKTENIVEYKRLHAAVWPQILELLKAAGMRNYSIFLKEPENLLFAYLEFDGDDLDAANAAIAENKDMQRWWKFTDPMQEPLPNLAEGEWWAEMEEVFHTD